MVCIIDTSKQACCQLAVAPRVASVIDRQLEVAGQISNLVRTLFVLVYGP